MNNSNIFPGWEIVEPIGSGGFSKVYKIRKTDSSRTDFLSALKVIEIPHSPDEYQSYRADGYDDNSITQIFDDQVKEIIQEFELMHQFRGVTNIVSYEDHLVIQNDNGIGWKILIRMELLQTLPDWYMCHSMKDSDVKQLGIDICRALKLCEQKNIVHRDIKPQNIFANAFDDFKLGDFGVARVMEHTTRATKIGTYSYMAPEVYNGKPYNYISDIYSLGMVLYWLLNERRLPFLPLPPAVPTPTMNNEAQMRRINGEPIPAPKYGSDELKAVVLKACAYDPKDRYASAEEFMQALQSAKCGGIVCNPTVTDTVDRAEHTATEIVTSPKIDDDVTVSIFHSGVPFDAEQPVAEDGTEAPSNASVLFGESVNTANSDDEKTVSMFFDNAVTAKPHREAPPESETPKQEKPIIEEPKKAPEEAPEEAPEKVTEEAPVASEANESEGETVKKRKLWVWLLLLGAVIAAVIVIAMSCGHEHSPNGRIKSYNSSYHWDECECGEILNKSEHVCDGWHIGVEPTETSEGTKARYCKGCPFIETEAIPPVGEGGDNSNDSDVSSDISTDVSTDVSTDTSTDVSTDISQDVSDTSSDVSVDTSADVSTDVSQEPDSSVVPDVSETHTHSYSSGWKSNETSHWKVCDCGEKSYTDAHKFSSWTTTKKATETTTGSKERTCNTCGYKETAKIPVLSHKHSYSSSWKSNETSHWTVCDCGEKNSLASHTYGAWKTTKSATCTTAGSKTRTCTVCGYKETAKISATGSHTYGSWTTTKSATCVATGSKKRTCSVCGKAETQTIAATGSHTYGDWTITLFPTCVDSGKEQRTCSVCGNAETISISPTGEHSYGSWCSTGAPDCCVTTGETQKRFCYHCDDTQTQVLENSRHWHSFDGSKCEYCGVEEDVDSNPKIGVFSLTLSEYSGLQPGDIVSVYISASSISGSLPDDLYFIRTRLFYNNDLFELVDDGYDRLYEAFEGFYEWEDLTCTQNSDYGTYVDLAAATVGGDDGNTFTSPGDDDIRFTVKLRVKDGAYGSAFIYVADGVGESMNQATYEYETYWIQNQGCGVEFA